MSSRPPVTEVVESFDTTRIAFDLYDAPSRSAVMVIPGFWRERRHPALVALAASLSRYKVAIMDARGHGASGGTYGFNLHEHHDVAAVMRKIDADRISIIGFSYGGAIAISTAARHPELPIASLLLISPVADFAMIMPRINPFTIHRHVAFSQAFRRPRFDWRVRGSTKLRALDDVRDVHVPLCFVHVKNDWLVGHAHSVALYEAANEPKELHVIDIPGNYHADRIFAVAKDEIESLVDDFLRRFGS